MSSRGSGRGGSVTSGRGGSVTSGSGAGSGRSGGPLTPVRPVAPFAAASKPTPEQLESFANQNAVEIDYTHLFIIVGLNAMMLIFGFMGETGRINHLLGCVLGFLPFIAMFYLIWNWYGAKGKNDMIFAVFFIVWSLYGIVYFLPSIPKNICYNLLDIIAKVGFGLLIWFEVVNMRLRDKLELEPEP
jgi:hypothetical protein